jgi:ComF family protein
MNKSSFKSIHNLILDTLLPIHCFGCGKEGVWMCKTCFKKIPSRKDQICPICERMITPDGRTCINCKPKTSLDGMLCATSYKISLIAEAVHRFKYDFVDGLHIPLAKLLIKELNNSNLPIADILIPIPLHKRRLRWRGFNQSELLARRISQRLLPNMEISVIGNAILRRKYTKPQKEIQNKKERMENIKDAFYVPEPTLIKDKTVFLVDDIATTGSTIKECAKF